MSDAVVLEIIKTVVPALTIIATVVTAWFQQNKKANIQADKMTEVQTAVNDHIDASKETAATLRTAIEKKVLVNAPAIHSDLEVSNVSTKEER